MECPGAEALTELAAGKLAADQRVAIANHASGCTSCHAVLDALFATRGDTPVAESFVETLGIDRAKATTLVAPGVDRSLRRALLPGDKVLRYVIEAVLGSGGMGVVYRARDPELDRAVAIKVLRRGVDGERLRREAQALAKLSHPNVVAVHDVGVHADSPFIAMALVDGDTLRQWLKTPRTREAVLDVLLAAGRGIAAAHEVGLIHRDLKPDNIFVARDGKVLVGDFGLARGIISGERAAVDRDGDQDVGDSGALGLDLTRSGVVVGTPAYMAPEQAAGDATIASDQFSFCVTAWEAFTQVRPFTGATTGEILANIRIGTITEPTGALPPRIARALRRGLQADPARRFQTMAELLRALEAPRSKRWIAVAGVLGVAAAATATLALMQRTSSSPVAPELPAIACGNEARLLAADWNPSRRGEIERALAGRPGSEVTRQRALTLLDHAAERWIAQRGAACETARRAPPSVSSRDLYDVQVDCFDRARRDLALVIDVLGAPNGPASAVASELVQSTPPSERCTNAANLVRVAPPDPTKREAIDRIRTALVETRVAAELHSTESWPELGKLRGEAEAIGYLPLIGELARTEAMLAYERDDYERAEAAARRALAIADQLRDDQSRAEVAAIVGSILARQGKFEGAAEQIAAAQAAWERAGKDPRTEIAILVAKADVARIQHLPDRIAATERMVDRVRQVYGLHSVHLARALMTLVVMYEVDQQAQAQRAATEAREIWSLQTGSLDQAVMTAVNRVDEAKAAGDLRQVIARQIEVVAIVAASVPGSGDEALVMYELGAYYEQATRWNEAAQAFRRALAIYEHDAATDRALIFDSLVALGRMAVELGQRDAIALLERARSMITRSLPANRDDVSILEVALGRAYAAAGRNSDAVAILDPLVEPLRAARPPRHLRFGLVCSTLASASWATGGTRERDRARALAGDARTAWSAATAELVRDPMRSDQVHLIDRRQQALAEWIAAHR